MCLFSKPLVCLFFSEVLSLSPPLVSLRQDLWPGLPQSDSTLTSASFVSAGVPGVCHTPANPLIFLNFFNLELFCMFHFFFPANLCYVGELFSPPYMWRNTKGRNSPLLGSSKAASRIKFCLVSQALSWVLLFWVTNDLHVVIVMVWGSFWCSYVLHGCENIRLHTHAHVSSSHDSFIFCPSEVSLLLTLTYATCELLFFCVVEQLSFESRHGKCYSNQ